MRKASNLSVFNVETKGKLGVDAHFELHLTKSSPNRGLVSGERV
jgi:hypothetical protein